VTFTFPFKDNHMKHCLPVLVIRLSPEADRALCIGSGIVSVFADRSFIFIHAIEDTTS